MDAVSDQVLSVLRVIQHKGVLSIPTNLRKSEVFCRVSVILHLEFKIRTNEEETDFTFLADLEYEFWLSGNSVWLCIAKCEC